MPLQELITPRPLTGEPDASAYRPAVASAYDCGSRPHPPAELATQAWQPTPWQRTRLQLEMQSHPMQHERDVRLYASAPDSLSCPGLPCPNAERPDQPSLVQTRHRPH